MRPLLSSARALQIFGTVAFLLAALSIADMYLPRPYDGVVLEADAPGSLRVREVVPGSGAHRAGIRPDDRILGIDRNVLRSTAHAAELLNRWRIGESVPYLVQRPTGVVEVEVEMGRRSIASPAYLYAVALGFAFFIIGVFVLRRQPHRRPAQIFFVLCILFLLFLVCRLRPASYSWTDSFILTTGMLALLFLPASFLHFFLIFPQPVALRPREGAFASRGRRRLWLLTLAALYLLPVVVLLVTLGSAYLQGTPLHLISGAPAANWWVLTLYMLLGLAVLGVNLRRLDEPRLRRGAALVLAGSLFGLVPFLIIAVAFPMFLHREEFLFYGVAPLALVPLTFGYAIVRFQLLDIRVILSKSLLYTVTTAVITGLYALGITVFNLSTRGTPLAASPFFPLLFALVIVLLFEPLRRRLQVVVDGFFFAGRSHLEQAMREMGKAFSAQADPAAVVRDLMERLPQVLGLHFAALYLLRDGALEQVAGPAALPHRLAYLPRLHDHLARRKRLTHLVELGPLELESAQVAELSQTLTTAGVEVLGDLTSPRRRIGLVLLSGKKGQLTLEEGELERLDSLLHQAAIALETSMLLEERTRQAELERELEIAASVQAELLPGAVCFGPGWQVAALCRPARHVGGDFYTELPGPREGSRAVIYGDVAGKSVPGALVMMAAHEALHSLAMTHRDPTRLMTLANRRLYNLGPKKSFVALAYLTSSAAGDGIEYILAGQPPPLVRRADGRVDELPLPRHRLPLGALTEEGYELCYVPLEPGDVLLGYSDGVVDALSPAGESFGTQRLTGVVAAAQGPPDALVARVLEALRDFTQGAEPYDDITLVAIACDREETRCASSG